MPTLCSLGAYSDLSQLTAHLNQWLKEYSMTDYAKSCIFTYSNQEILVTASRFTVALQDTRNTEVKALFNHTYDGIFNNVNEFATDTLQVFLDEGLLKNANLAKVGETELVPVIDTLCLATWTKVSAIDKILLADELLYPRWQYRPVMV